MKFYTSFFLAGNILNVRGYDGCTQFFEEHTLSPSHYIPTMDKNTGHKSFYDHDLKKVDFDNVWDARAFRRDNKDISVFGYPNYEYTKISELYTEEHDSSKVRVAIVDIETLVGDDQDGNPENYDAFPNTEDPKHAVSLITTIFGTEVFVYGLKYEWDLDIIKQHIVENLPADNNYKNLTFVFEQYDTDKLLLGSFMKLMKAKSPDIISGWNSNGFDIPYMCSRIKKLFGDNTHKRLSPFNLVDSRMVNTKYGQQLEYDIKGIEQLDYLELYKKFELSPRENYKLETIAMIELGAGKLEYEGSFQNFYKGTYEVTSEEKVTDEFTRLSHKRYLIKKELEKRGITVPQ